jgi:hypothetical protein
MNPSVPAGLRRTKERRSTPELGNVGANLELLPLRRNESKNARKGARHHDCTQKPYKVGLLAKKRLGEILRKRWPRGPIDILQNRTMVRLWVWCELRRSL